MHERGPHGPRFFCAPACGTIRSRSSWEANGRQALTPTIPFWSYWYYHLPNLVMAAVMYTLLGRALLGLFVDPDSSNYIWRFFCRITDPVIALFAFVTPKATAPVVLWLFCFVWLFWLRVGFDYGMRSVRLVPTLG